MSCDDQMNMLRYIHKYYCETFVQLINHLLADLRLDSSVQELYDWCFMYPQSVQFLIQQDRDGYYAYRMALLFVHKL